MRVLSFALCLFCTSLSFAQTDSSQKAVASFTQSNVINLTRADIERLPVANFLDLVAGAFPFLGTEGLEEDFAYVVNGFVLVNPNVINLSQIESISFYPGGTPFTRGSFAKKGTFVISTKPQANRLYASTKIGLLSTLR